MLFIGVRGTLYFDIDVDIDIIFLAVRSKKIIVVCLYTVASSPSR